jgi:hypothetical protein
MTAAASHRARLSELDAPFGAPLPSFMGKQKNNASRPFEAKLSCRLQDDSGAKRVAGTKDRTLSSCPRLSRASRCNWHGACLIEIAGTSPAMTPVMVTTT